jgi:hypothetical protein
MNRSAAPDPRPDTAWLTAALREQAQEHEADATRIDAKFERLIADDPRRSRGRAGPRRRPQVRPRRGRLVGPLRLRLIGIPLGILAAVASAAVAVAVTLGIGDGTGHSPNQGAPAPTPSRTAMDQRPTSQTTASAVHPAGTASTHSQSSPTAPAGPLTAVGIVDSHSTQYWSQENLTVTTTRAVRGLHVIVAVSGGTTVQSTGSWTTILPANVDTTVRTIPGGLTYDITLKAGQTLQPTSYLFGFQFNRPASGHTFTLDTYTVTATLTDNAAQATASGTFAQ